MKKDEEYTKEELDHRSKQLNPNNDAYWKSRRKKNPRRTVKTNNVNLNE